MKFNTITCAAIVAFHCIGTAFAGGEGWTSDFEAAKKQAAEEKKDLLIDFTGSDWCGWCIKLNEEVFSKDEFKKGVKDKYVLVEIDFPKDQAKLSAATKKQNEELQEKFAVEGFPTIILADASGRPFGQTGYEPDGPVKYLANLANLSEKKTRRDTAFAAAAKAEGIEKAKKLVDALKDLELKEGAAANFYSAEVEQIKAADPKDETGFTKDLAAQAKKLADSNKLQQFEQGLGEFAEKEDHEGALAYVDKTLKEGGFEGEAKQQVAVTKAMIYAHIKKYDEASKAVDEAKAIAPDSEMAKQFDQFKEQIKELKSQPAGGAEDEHDHKHTEGDGHDHDHGKKDAPKDGAKAEKTEKTEKTEKK